MYACLEGKNVFLGEHGGMSGRTSHYQKEHLTLLASVSYPSPSLHLDIYVAMLSRASSSFLPLLLLLAVTFCSTLANAQVSNDDPTGKEIYIVAPACDSYQCKNNWRRGKTYDITWLNAPKGGLKIQLEPENDDSLPTYTITKKVGSTHNQSKCKSVAHGETCGTTTWTVPDDIKLGEYTVAATSLAHPKKIGYTDTVVIRKKSSKRSEDETLIA